VTNHGQGNTPISNGNSGKIPTNNEMLDMNLKKELRPLARQLVSTLERNGDIDKANASSLRNDIKRRPKSEIVKLIDELNHAFSQPSSNGTSGGSGIPKPSSQPTTPSPSNEPDSEPSGEPDSEPTSSDDTSGEPPTKDDVEQMIAQALLSAKANSTPEPVTKPSASGKLEHWQMPLIKAIVETNRQALLVGGAGSGKTTIAQQIATDLGFTGDDFYSISLSAGVSEAHLTGRMVMTGEFLDTKFLNIVENGGLILLDEFDNGDADVMVSLNSLLANDEISVPLRRGNETAIRHKDCYILATANTWGNGSGGSSGYVRKQLDSATLDRFVCSKMYLGTDRRIVNLVMGLSDETVTYPLPMTLNTAFQPTVALKQLRAMLDFLSVAINDKRRAVNHLLGVRGYMQGARLVRDANISPLSVLEIYLSNWTDDQLKTVNIKRDYDAKLDYFTYDFSTFENEVFNV